MEEIGRLEGGSKSAVPVTASVLSSLEEQVDRSAIACGNPPQNEPTGTVEGTDAAGMPVTCNAARERTRVKTLRTAFQELQQALPCVPPNTKLSKLDVLVLATMYIAHLMGALQQGESHPACQISRQSTQGSSSGLRIQQQHRVGRRTIGEGSRCPPRSPEYLHPVKKWPMRTRLYAGLAARARGSPPLEDTTGTLYI